MGNSSNTNSAQNTANNNASNSLSGAISGSNTLQNLAQNTLQQTSQNTAQQNAQQTAQNSAQQTAQQNAQQTAQQTAQNTNSSSQTDPSAAASALINQATNPANTISNIQSFLNPYTQDVLNSQVALENQQNQVQQQQLTGNAISQNALGGDRAKIAQAALMGQQGLANNATNAGILQSGYGQALTAAQALAGQQLQGAGLSGTQTSGTQANTGTTAGTTAGASLGNTTGSTAGSTVGNTVGSTTGLTSGQTSQQQAGSTTTGTMSAQNAASAGTGATSGAQNTTQVPGLASDIGLGLGLLTAIPTGGASLAAMPALMGRVDGGRVGLADGGSTGSSDGQYVYVPSQQGGTGGQWLWMPSMAISQGKAQGPSQAGGAGQNASQGQSPSEMFKLGQQARSGISNILSGAFGTSSTPTTSDGGWQTSTQTPGLIGSGGVGSSLNAGFSNLGQGINNVGSAISARMPDLSMPVLSTPTVSTPVMSDARAPTASVEAPTAATPKLSMPEIGTAKAPTVAQSYAPQAQVSSGKGSGGAVRGFANGGDADFGDEDADYSIGDAFRDGNDILLDRDPADEPPHIGGLSLANPGQPGLQEQEKAHALSLAQNHQGNVYPPAVWGESGVQSLGRPEARRFPEVQPKQPAAPPATPQDIIAMLGNENDTLKNRLTQLEDANSARSQQPPAPHVEEDAGRDVAAAGFANPLAAEALRGPAFHSDAPTLADLPAAAPKQSAPWQTSVEGGAPPAAEKPAAPAPSEAPEGGYWARAVRDFHPLSPLEKLRQAVNPDPTEYPGAQWSAATPDAPRKPEGPKAIEESPTADWSGNGQAQASAPNLSAPPQGGLPADIPLPTRRPANLGQTPEAEPPAPFEQRIGAALEKHPEETSADPFATSAQPLPGRKGVVQGIVQEMRGAGMSDSAIRGILVNVKDESAFNPGLRVADQPRWGGEAHFAHGLFQEGGEEWNHYASWLKQNAPDADWRDPRMQTRFLAQNLQQNYPAVWKTMNEGTPEQAAQAFVGGYLKPRADLAAARSAQYGRGVPGVDDFLNGAVGAAKNVGEGIGRGIQDVGEGVYHGARDVGQGVYSGISQIGNHLASALGGGNSSPEQKNQDRGLFANLLGFDPMNMSADQKHSLMNIAQLMASYGANQMPAGIQHIQEQDTKQKALERQVKNDALHLQMEVEKLKEQHEYHQGVNSRLKNAFVSGMGIDEKGNNVPGSYSANPDDPNKPIFHPGVALNPRGNSSGNEGGTHGWLYRTWLTNHPGDTKGAEDFASGHKSMGDAEIEKTAMLEAGQEGRSQGLMGDKLKAYIDARQKELATTLRSANRQARAPQPGQNAAPTQNAAPAQAPQQQVDPLAKARTAIAAGAPRDAVIKRLKDNGIDPSGL